MKTAILQQPRKRYSLVYQYNFSLDFSLDFLVRDFTCGIISSKNHPVQVQLFGFLSR